MVVDQADQGSDEDDAGDEERRRPRRPQLTETHGGRAQRAPLAEGRRPQPQMGPGELELAGGEGKRGVREVVGWAKRRRRRRRFGFLFWLRRDALSASLSLPLVSRGTGRQKRVGGLRRCRGVASRLLRGEGIVEGGQKR